MIREPNLRNYDMISSNDEKLNFIINTNFNSLFRKLISSLPGMISEALDVRLDSIGSGKFLDGNGRMGTHESRLRDSSGSRESLFERRRGDLIVKVNEIERRRGDRMVNGVNEFQ